MKKLKRLVMLTTMLSVVFLTASCRKPYDVPEYKTVTTSQTAYLIPLEGDSKKQVKLDSAKAYDAMKVMKKRIQITKRWNQTGRRSNQGDWIPSVSLIVVERTPVTKEWNADATKGTKNKDEAIWVESKDSIEFSTGFNCTAYIKETDASTFLYFYKANSLAGVMDEEIRNKIQEVMAEFAAGYDLDELRTKKREMIAAVRKGVIDIYNKRGITITTIGMFGGLEYKNPAIQKSIDDVFVSQQLKNVEKAKLSAMADQKKRMEEEGRAHGMKAKEIAVGEANAARERADAVAYGIDQKAKSEAKAILAIAAALKEAQSNPMFLEIKKLEVESKRIAKWKGDVSRTSMTLGAGATPLIQVPNE